MWSLTLTPELQPYATAAIVVWCAGSGAVAGALSARRDVRPGPGFLELHALLMAAVGAFAIAIEDLPTVTSPPPGGLLAAIPVGGAAALAAVAGERRLARALRQRPRPRAGVAGPVSPVPVARPFEQGAGRRRLLLLLLAVAALEELLYRGVLLDLSLRLPTPFAALALAAGVLAFALAHLPLGAGQAAGKLPLGAAATVAAVATGTVAAAVVAHVLYNTHAWRLLTVRDG